MCKEKAAKCVAYRVLRKEGTQYADELQRTRSASCNLQSKSRMAQMHWTTDKTPVSYWLATAPLAIAPTELSAGADVVVVGGGLLGTATAYWLARAGADVTLIEAGSLAGGASGRNGGFV